MPEEKPVTTMRVEFYGTWASVHFELMDGQNVAWKVSKKELEELASVLKPDLWKYREKFRHAVPITGKA